MRYASAISQRGCVRSSELLIESSLNSKLRLKLALQLRVSIFVAVVSLHIRNKTMFFFLCN